MERLPAVLAVVAVAAAAGGALASVPGGQRSFKTSAVVTAMSADGSVTAFAVAAKPHDCYHVDLWNRSSRSVVRLGRARNCGPETSTGSGLVGPGLAGTRALWVTYTGGNIREWTLWTATSAATKPKRLQFVARDVDLAAPFVLGEGDSSAGYLFPYSIDRKLHSLRRDGRSVLYLNAAAPIVAVEANRDKIAATLATGSVEIVSAPNKILRTETFANPVDAVRLAGNALVAQHGRMLTLRAGTVSRSWTLPTQSKLADADGGLAVYARPHELHLFNLSTGRDVLFRRTATTPVAQLEPAGLTYAVGRTLTFVPRALLAV